MKIFLAIVGVFVVAAFLFKRFKKQPEELKELEERVKKARGDRAL